MFPSFAQFSRWAETHAAVPLWIEPEIPAAGVLDWAHSLNSDRNSFFFLHSAAHTAQARYSFLSLDDPRYTLECREGSLTVRYHADAGAGLHAVKVGNPIDRLQEWFSRMRGPRVDALPPFWGGAVGYLGFESAGYFDSQISRVLHRRAARPGLLAMDRFPEFELGVYDAVAIVDHALQKLWLVCTVLLPEGKTPSPQQLERIYRSSQDRLRRYAVHLQRAIRAKTVWGTFRVSGLRASRSAAAYQVAARRARGYLQSGEVQQLHLGQYFHGTWEGDPWMLYKKLTSVMPAPYAALLRTGRRWMASASDSLLVRQKADLVECPYQPESDVASSDLSPICSPESIAVSQTLALAPQMSNIRMTSDVRGQLLPNKGWKEALQACFPGGMITGCPKIRSIELIRHLEALQRGPFGGALGWMGFGGDMTFSTNHQTFFLDNGKMALPVGATILPDSDPRQCYQETIRAAEKLLQASPMERSSTPSSRKRK